MDCPAMYSATTMTATVSMIAMFGDAVGGVPLKDGDLIAALLLMLLGIALGIGVTCLVMVVHFLRKGRLDNRSVPRRVDMKTRERRLHAPIFNVPSRWLAVRSGNPLLVQAALGLNNPTPCSWEEGLSAAHEQRLFISPPIAAGSLSWVQTFPNRATTWTSAFGDRK